MPYKYWMLAVLGASAGLSAAAADQKVLESHSHRMFEDTYSSTQVSADGAWALRTSIDGRQALYALPSGAPDEARLNGGLAGFRKAQLCGAGLLRLGAPEGEPGWFREGHAAVAIPAGARPLCSDDGRQLAYRLSASPRSVWIGDDKRQAEVELPLAITRLAFNHAGNTLYALAFDAGNGLSTLYAIDVATRQTTVLRERLDATRLDNAMAVAPRDDALFLPLASSGVPQDAARQQPSARRWLKLYRFDLASRQLTLVHAGKEEDEDDPVVVKDQLYWTSNRTPLAVAVAPAGGGDVRHLGQGWSGYAPEWHPSGKQLAFTFGDYRRADLPLDQDIAVVGVDGAARTTTKPKPLVTQNNEDMMAAWSPDGTWLAFHSHQAPRPVPYVSAPGATDDIWLRRAAAGKAAPVRVTDNLHDAGWVFWAPDGRSLLYAAGNKQTGKMELMTSRIDPDTGRVLAQDIIKLPPGIKAPLVAEYSPSGATIAVQDLTSPTESTLWLMGRDGTGATKLLTYRNDTVSGFGWLPDGSGLVYSGLDGERMQLFSIPVGGGTPRRLTQGDGNYLHPRVSPDGRWVAFSDMETVLTLWRAPLASLPR